MAHFVLSHFYLPQPRTELRTAQFRETTSAFCMHVGHWLWPSRFLQDSLWQESVLASPSHLQGRTVPWRCLTGRFGDAQMCTCCAPLQAGPGCQCLSVVLSKAQLSATAWPIPAQPCTGDADTLQWHPRGFAEPSEAPGLLMPPHLWGPCVLLLGHAGSGLAGCARGEPGCPRHASLCTVSCVPAQSYPLRAVSTRIWAPSPSYFQVFSSFTAGFPFPQL